MKNKRPFIYLGISILVAIAVIIIENPLKPRADDVGEGYFIPDYDIEKVERVEVEQLIDAAILKKGDDGWFAAEGISPLKRELLKKEERAASPARWHKADAARVRAALGVFGGLDEGVLVSKNPDKRVLYQVDNLGLHVRTFGKDDRPILDVIIGKNGPDYSSSYIRKADEDEVYLVNRILTGIFSPHSTDWRDKMIWSERPNDIESADILKGSNNRKIIKDEDENFSIEGSGNAKAADGIDLKKIINSLARIRAVDFIEDKDAEGAGLANPPMTITITTSNGRVLKLNIGNKDASGNYYASKEGGDEIYTVSGKDIALILELF